MNKNVIPRKELSTTYILDKIDVSLRGQDISVARKGEIARDLTQRANKKDGSVRLDYHKFHPNRRPSLDFYEKEVTHGMGDINSVEYIPENKRQDFQLAYIDVNPLAWEKGLGKTKCTLSELLKMMTLERKDRFLGNFEDKARYRRGTETLYNFEWEDRGFKTFSLNNGLRYSRGCKLAHASLYLPDRKIILGDYVNLRENQVDNLKNPKKITAGDIHNSQLQEYFIKEHRERKR